MFFWAWVLLVFYHVSYAVARPSKQLNLPPVTTNSEDIEQSFSLGDIKVSPALTHVIDKRQGDVQRILKATYFYECPMSGRRQRYFKWRGLWRASDSTFFLTALDNVHKIKELHDNAPAFWGTWEGYACIMRGTFFCSYVYFGKTEGVVFAGGVLMSLVTESNTPGESPEVSELCVDTTTLPPDTCPTLHPMTGIVNCHIYHIEVVVVRPDQH